MAYYTHRVQAILSEEQFAILQQLAKKTGQPISVLVREAVEKVYIEKTLIEERQKALARLLSLEAPVADWPQMEEEIKNGLVE
jgi:predicted transcriptional regulator